AGAGDGELGDRCLNGCGVARLRVDAADPVAAALGEPELVVRANGDVQWAAGRRQGELGDRARPGDTGDATGIELGEPEVVVGPADDPRRGGVRREAGRE